MCQRDWGCSVLLQRSFCLKPAVTDHHHRNLGNFTDHTRSMDEAGRLVCSIVKCFQPWIDTSRWRWMFMVFLLFVWKFPQLINRRTNYFYFWTPLVTEGWNTAEWVFLLSSCLFFFFFFQGTCSLSLNCTAPHMATVSPPSSATLPLMSPRPACVSASLGWEITVETGQGLPAHEGALDACAPCSLSLSLPLRELKSSDPIRSDASNGRSALRLRVTFPCPVGGRCADTGRVAELLWKCVDLLRGEPREVWEGGMRRFGGFVFALLGILSWLLQKSLQCPAAISGCCCCCCCCCFSPGRVQPTVNMQHDVQLHASPWRTVYLCWSGVRRRRLHVGGRAVRTLHG